MPGLGDFGASPAKQSVYDEGLEMALDSEFLCLQEEQNVSLQT